MPNTLREVLGELRFRLSNALKARYPDTYGATGFMQTTEAYFVKTMYNIDPQARHADYYIAPGDGGGPIAVEIGRAADNKWEDLISTDGKPVRVLRVNLDGLAQLLHPRATPFEEALLDVLK
ncbi:MAG: hypothetical protein HY741_06015 [Chloroflexi bacterium]|nr:hypothetical protein [Chloroflexota bacterium]